MDQSFEEALASLVGHAEAADRHADWPETSWSALANAGIFRWSIPVEFGGDEISADEQLARQERIAAACLTTAFILSQREAAVRHLVRGPSHLKKRFLPKAASGELFTTVGLSQLTTSRQHGAPALLATAVGDGFEVDGEMPWVTGADQADVVIAGATQPDLSQILFALPMDRKGVEVDPPLPLAALMGSRTAVVRCRRVRVETDLLMSGPAERVLGPIGGGGLETSNLALGAAEAATCSIEREAERRPDLGDAARRFRAAVDAARLRLHAPMLATNPSAVMAVRVECTRLALKATQAALLIAKGVGFLGSHPAQRWARQALFFLVWSCPRPVAEGVLDELLPAEIQ